MELKFRELTGYEDAGELIVTHEESMETAIPEYCPDLARIIDTVGQIKLREKSASDGKVTVSGGIRVTVLYTSEESAGLRSLTLSVPFSCTVEDPRDCQVICVDGRLLLLEAKALGARKLYVRVLPEFRIRGYRKVTQRLCSGVEEESGLQTQQCSVTLSQLSGILEREFHFAQEIPPEKGQDTPEDLLLDRAFLRIDSCQSFGSKLVVKGEAALSLLYRTEGQKLCCRNASLPFSQIIDCEELPEDALFSVSAQIMEQEVHPVRTEEGSGFGVTMRVCLQVCIYQKRQITYIADLYSTRCDMTVRQQEVSFPTTEPPTELRCSADQRLEGTGAFAYLTDADTAQPELATENGRPVARTSVRMRVLYLDESGAPVTAERTCEVSAVLQETPDTVQAVTEPESWQRTGNGFDLRQPVLFRLGCNERTEITAVTMAEEQGKLDRGNQPSLILRRLGQGETLWDVAKRCHTERGAILSANELENESDAGGVLLLIPKTR